MKINKITGLILFILSVFTVVIYYLSVLIGAKLATSIFFYDCFIFLIIGFIWFVSLFFVKKEEGNKIKIFFKLVSKLFLVAFVWILVVGFIGEPATLYGESSSSGSQMKTFSMTTTAGNGSALVGITPNKTYFVNKISGVNRGSIVSYVISKDGYESDEFSRVIGLPNEKVVVKQGIVEINGNSFSEKYADWSQWGKGDVASYELKDNEYLVTFDLARTLKSLSVISKQSIKGVIK